MGRLGVLLVLGAGPTVVGFGLYNVSHARLPSSVVNLILTLELPMAAVTAYLLLGERFSRLQVWGGLATLAGVAVVRIQGLKAAGDGRAQDAGGSSPAGSPAAGSSPAGSSAGGTGGKAAVAATAASAGSASPAKRST